LTDIPDSTESQRRAYDPFACLIRTLKPGLGTRQGYSPGKEVIQMASNTTRKVGKDAKTGYFISVEEAQRRKATAYVQTIKVPKKKAK
jgi:hypothetical protein